MRGTMPCSQRTLKSEKDNAPEQHLEHGIGTLKKRQSLNTMSRIRLYGAQSHPPEHAMNRPPFEMARSNRTVSTLPAPGVSAAVASKV